MENEQAEEMSEKMEQKRMEEEMEENVAEKRAQWLREMVNGYHSAGEWMLKCQDFR